MATSQVAGEVETRVQQPVPLLLLPPAVASAKTAGSKWALVEPDLNRSVSSVASASSSRGVSQAASFLDTGESDEEDAYEDNVWPAAGTEAHAMPPPAKMTRSKPKKASLWKRALSGKWRKLGARSSATWAKIKRKTRISSKSSKERWPKSWKAYRKAYADRHIDIDDPPDAPGRDAGGNEKTPYEAKVLLAPRPSNERERQATLNRINPLGYASEVGTQIEPVSYEPGNLKENEICQPTPPDAFGPSLKSHPAFKRIVAFARQAFGTSFSMLSILDEDQQIFLAESGLGGMEKIDRDISFCAHSLLASTRGLVILDTHKDWRFANAPLTQSYGSRFYAGVPLLAPKDATHPHAGNIPLGTLCIVDNKPRDSFDELERRKLIGLANYARSEIDAWQRARMDAKLKKMDDNYQSFRASLPNRASRLTVVEEIAEPRVEPELVARPESELLAPPANTRRRSSEATSISTAASTAESGASSYTSAATSLNASARTASTATRLVAEALDLDLVYVVRIELASKLVSLVAAHGLQSTEEAQFSPALHLKALRSVEKGLLYQNPRAEDFKAGERFPVHESEFASALLVPISESAERGFVLAGYTTDTRRGALYTVRFVALRETRPVFGAEDLLYLRDIASELRTFL